MLLLKDSPELIKWDLSGECTLNGDIAEGSNIVDLLNYVLNPYQKMISPTGAKRFLYTLRLLKVPVSTLGVKIREKLSNINTITLRKKRTLAPIDHHSSSNPDIIWENFDQLEKNRDWEDI
jgi:hypothetical protein